MEQKPTKILKYKVEKGAVRWKRFTDLVFPLNPEEARAKVFVASGKEGKAHNSNHSHLS